VTLRSAARAAPGRRASPADRAGVASALSFVRPSPSASATSSDLGRVFGTIRWVQPPRRLSHEDSRPWNRSTPAESRGTGRSRDVPRLGPTSRDDSSSQNSGWTGQQTIAIESLIGSDSSMERMIDIASAKRQFSASAERLLSAHRAALEFERSISMRAKPPSRRLNCAGTRPDRAIRSSRCFSPRHSNFPFDFSTRPCIARIPDRPKRLGGLLNFCARRPAARPLPSLSTRRIRLSCVEVGFAPARASPPYQEAKQKVRQVLVRSTALSTRPSTRGVADLA
jgi:hypothetical protein